MKEEYVTYEQAVKLKELGFDGVDKYYVTESFCIDNNPDDCYSKGQLVDEYIVYFTNENNEDDYRGVPAPRLDQAQKWLREVKGIIVWISPEFYEGDALEDVKWYFYTQPLQNLRKQRGGKVESKYYDTYELALSAGIDAALELLTDEMNDDR